MLREKVKYIKIIYYAFKKKERPKKQHEKNRPSPARGKYLE